jgi:glucosamine 6-phosphate synthetase-like amidotransferase/phosphosugar isomerase protein/DNA-directed RNA polymerase subunit RPC12/RpoP
MCGIMGYYAFGEILPNKKKIEDMFTLLETRGTDASGFAYLNNKNELQITKAETPASELVKTISWRGLQLPKIMIFHTRMKTQGEPSNNMNNHPLFTKKGLAIVHNGMIYNDKEIFGTKEKRDAEVDSEAILLQLSSKSKDPIKKVFETLEGGFAVASIDKNKPSELVLFRKDNPIELYYNSEEDILYFCSEREIMQETLKIKKYSKRGFRLGEKEYHFYELENNHALIINPEGVHSYKEYYPKRNYTNWFVDDLDDTIEIECPYCLSVTKFNYGMLNNRCSTCGEIIEEDALYV